MNNAERLRDERIAKMSDLDLLGALCVEPRDEALTLLEFNAFQDMLRILRSFGGKLWEGQRAWAEEAMRRITPLDAREVPWGREVEPPQVLKNLPLKPPGRR